MTTTDQHMTAVEALHAFARRAVDAEAAQALVDQARREILGEVVARPEQNGEQPAPTDTPLVLRRVVEHALRKPVPCPKCSRTAPCRCIADRTDARVEVLLGAIAPWLRTSDAA